MRRRVLGLSVALAIGAVGTWSCGGGESADPSGGGGLQLVGGASGNGDGATLGGAGGAPGGSGGFGGSGGGFVDHVTLGRACATQAECGADFTCVKPDADLFDGEGPAKGYCTLDCTADSSACTVLQVTGGPIPSCVPMQNGKSYCFEGCNFGPSSLTQFDTDKCHGRPEVACAEVVGAPNPACFPQCNADADCGGGLFCNPRTGRCRTTPITGDPIGMSCTSSDDAGTSACRGTCMDLAHDGSQQPFTHFCTESCTLNALAACGWLGVGTGPAPAVCLYGGVGSGDLASCDQLCDDNCGCSDPDLVCMAWTGADAQAVTDYFQRAGYCADPLGDDGGTNPGISCTSDASLD